MTFKKTTLKNGLRILTVPMKGTETATVAVMVGVGSRFEKEKEAGLSHFIEHMLFKGTKKRPTTKDISEEMDSFGGEFNAFTSKETTFYYAKVDSKHIHQAFDIIADMFLDSKIDQEEIKKEKGTIIQEINMYEDMPMRNVWDVFENFIYKGNSLGREVVGSKETVSSFKRGDFIKYIKNHYNSSNVAVCVAGKINEKKIIEDAKKYFEKLQKGKKLQIKKVIESQKYPRVKIKFKKTDQTQVIIGNRAYRRDHKNKYALSLMSIILGGNMSSRLFIEVRERRGLAYSVHTAVEAYEDSGYIATQAGVDHEKLEETMKVILEEYKKIATEKVDAKELKKAKDFVKGRAVMGLESSDEVAMFYIEQEMHKEKILNLKEIFAKIDAVTAEDILRVAKDVFRKEKINCAIIGPHKNSKKIEKILNRK